MNNTTVNINVGSKKRISRSSSQEVERRLTRFLELVRVNASESGIKGLYNTCKLHKVHHTYVSILVDLGVLSVSGSNRYLIYKWVSNEPISDIVSVAISISRAKNVENKKLCDERRQVRTFFVETKSRPMDMFRVTHKTSNSQVAKTQAEIAKEIGVDKSTVSRWLKKPTTPIKTETKAVITTISTDKQSKLELAKRFAKLGEYQAANELLDTIK
jgi:DNA-binding transcriptional ArsR family regulator